MPASASRRMVFVRRRTTALCVVVLAIAWIAGLGPGSPPAVHRSAVPVHSAASGAIAATAAEYAREQAGIANVLSYTPIVTRGGSTKREIALTFDDGPGPYTPKVLAELTRLHVPATFFIVGVELKYFGASLLSELQADYVIGDHTENHLPMATLSVKDQRSQLLDQAAAIAKYGAPFPHLFRPPYGSYDNATLALAKKLGMLTVLWTIDTSDYRQPGIDSIVHEAVDNATPGAIVLMHDAGGPRSETIAAIPRVVAALRKRGYKLVTVPRLMADDPPSRAQVAVPTTLVGG